MLLALVTCLLFSVTVVGRNPKQVTDSIKQLIATQRTLVQQADGAGDIRLGIAMRLRLSTLLKPKEAQEVLQEGAMMAGAAQLLDEEITIRSHLAQAYAAGNDHGKAYSEALKVTSLMSERMLDREERMGARNDSVMARLKEDHNTTVRADMIRQMEVQEALDRQRLITKRWMLIASGVFVVASVVLLLMLVRVGKRADRARQELAALRAEVTALKDGGVVQGAGGTPTIDTIGPHDSDELRASAHGVDSTVWAFFRKRAPERLTTLQAARAAGDIDKVVRVVHTLKPMLVAFDTEHFGVLCPRITDVGAHLDQSRWNADLDTLEKAIGELLGSAS